MSTEHAPPTVMPTILRGQIVVALKTGSENDPMVLRDKEQERVFLPIFTSRLNFAQFAQTLPPERRPSHGVFDNIHALVQTMRPWLTVATRHGLEYIAVNHPGPAESALEVCHIRVDDLLALPAGATEVMLDY